MLMRYSRADSPGTLHTFAMSTPDDQVVAELPFRSKSRFLIMVIGNVLFATITIALVFLAKTLFRKLRSFLRTSTGLLTTKDHVLRQDALAELRSIRESGVRDSERVVDLWYSTISHELQSVGQEKWAVLEQVFIAALDVHDPHLPLECLDTLQKHFKKSSRVTRLLGMYLEKSGSYDDARAVYTRLLNDDETNLFARKRLIAILKAERKTVEAVDELKRYLETFMSDFEAWNELADLYLSEGDYKHAAFCMEEMLLSNPHNHLYCQRYAEIKYTEGGQENLELARTYFAQACQLNPCNLRSVYGLLLTCSALDNQLGKALESVSSLSSGLREEAKKASATGAVTYSPVSSSNLFNVANSCGISGNNTDGNSARNPNPTSAQFSRMPISNTERNRQLARWAISQIIVIYQARDNGSADLPPSSCPNGVFHLSLHSSIPPVRGSTLQQPDSLISKDSQVTNEGAEFPKQNDPGHVSVDRDTVMATN
ncbi:unnamed protein product [Calicophoron daubneyi]|uniref:ER membrane protein complex subunit 2 n=1 Tax=Calicophoron daubneyi TaxID=300641 RepID=A0AAV2T3C2_CALDB